MPKQPHPPEFSQAQLDHLKRSFPMLKPDWKDTIEVLQRRAGWQDVIDHIARLVETT